MAGGIVTINNAYPAPPGDKRESIIDITGPSSYTQVTLAAPITTGGQQLTPAQFGLQSFKEVRAVAAVSIASHYYSVRVYLSPQPSVGNIASTAILQWLEDGTEVSGGGNLSGVTMRLYAKEF